jgi:hypothetical protein
LFDHQATHGQSKTVASVSPKKVWCSTDYILCMYLDTSHQYIFV